MKNKFKSILKRSKALIAAAAIAVTSAMTAAVACAEEAVTEGATDTGSQMSTVLADAGEQITGQFSDLVATIIPVLIGIIGTGLVIFGIVALVKLAKKIFGKVAG